MRITFSLSGICFLLIFTACEQDVTANWKALNLLQYGVPVSVMAPDSADVKSGTLGYTKDIVVKKGKNYNIQLFASDASTTDIAALKAGQIEEAKANPFFKEILSEEADGFIFKTAIDTSTINYEFRYVHLQGGKEYIFRNGLTGTFTLEDATRMYEAVQQNK